MIAVSDMGIVNQLTPTYFKKLLVKIDHSPYTILDANLPQETIEYLSRNLIKTKLIFDPVSITKATKVKDVLNKFYAIKVNKTEAEALTGLTLDTQEMIVKAGLQLLDYGVERIFITMGSGGVYYQDKHNGFFRKAIKTSVVNATGAGDAFTAAMIYGFTENLNSEQLVDFCIGASTITLAAQETISSDLTIDTVNAILNNHH